MMEQFMVLGRLWMMGIAHRKYQIHGFRQWTGRSPERACGHVDYVIVDSLLEMSRRLGCHSIIEGVENSKVADIVGDLNATLLQGYHYSRPVCRKDFERLLDEDRGQGREINEEFFCEI